MDIAIVDFENIEQSHSSLQETHQPLLENETPPKKQPKTISQKAVRKTFKGIAHLANLLPTGIVLMFQILSPAFTHQGQCPTLVNKFMTLCLLGCCILLCFLLSFTDSVRDEKGKVRYGMATSKGLWVIDGSVRLSEHESANYRVRFIDFLHAFMSIMVFVAVAMFDKNVTKCFNPKPSEEFKGFLVALPVGIGIVCSLLFIIFPSKRHGIGFPLSHR